MLEPRKLSLSGSCLMNIFGKKIRLSHIMVTRFLHDSNHSFAVTKSSQMLLNKNVITQGQRQLGCGIFKM